MTYKPGDQPDPDFTAFFAGPWQKLLKDVVIPGTDGKVSWDRRAAYLLWLMGSYYDAETPWHWLDVMKHAVRPVVDVTLAARNVMERYPKLMGHLHAAELFEDNVTVGTSWADVNHFEIIDCTPASGGVNFKFDSSKYGDKTNE